jgi:acyl-coenzyme A thioesterase PaaI-like protein
MMQADTLTHPIDRTSTCGMKVEAAPFRLSRQLANAQLAGFNQRRELAWFGLQGQLRFPNHVAIRFSTIQTGFLGGGGVAAINGGVIAAGFDAACVLAALMQFDAKTVVTLTLQVQYLRLAHCSDSLEFQAWVTKSARHICFVQSVLVDTAASPQLPLAMASATLAPI